MSFFGSIGGFFKKIGLDLEKEAASNTAISSTITISGALLQTLVTLTAGDAAGAVVGDVVSDVNKSLAAVDAVVTTTTSLPATTTKQVVTNILTSVHTNLAQLLSAAEVKNSQHAATITGVVNTVDTELANVVNAL